MIIAPINYYQKLRGMDCIEFLEFTGWKMTVGAF